MFVAFVVFVALCGFSICVKDAFKSGVELIAVVAAVEAEVVVGAGVNGGKMDDSEDPID